MGDINNENKAKQQETSKAGKERLWVTSTSNLPRQMLLLLEAVDKLFNSPNPTVLFLYSNWSTAAFNIKISLSIWT